MLFLKKSVKYLFIVIIILLATSTFASVTGGTIDSSYKSALLCKNDSCSETSQINFKPTLGTPVHVTDTAITGNVWSEDFGWINLSPSQGGVHNTANGVLSGYAWGENAGWINFKPTHGGVTINANGEFGGYAWAQNYGWIKFDCNVTNACVKTSWRYPSESQTTSGSSISSTIVNNPSTSPVPVSTPSVPDSNNNMPIDDKKPVPTTEDIKEPAVPPTETQPQNPPSVTPNNLNNKLVSTNTSNSGGSSRISVILGLSDLADSVKNVISTSFHSVKKITKNVSGDVVKIVESPTGDVTSKTIATSGLIFSAYISVTTVLFSNPITFSEIFLIPIRLWGLLLTAFGIKKRNAPWGTVYDSVTKQPLDPVYVVLKDLSDNEIATSITDLDGRYGFLVSPGQYKIVASKTNYEFPSKKLSGQNSDVLYNDLYFSEMIEIKEGEVITKNIPMDPVKFDWNEFAKNQQKLTRFFSKKELIIARLSNTLFYVGIIISVIATIVSPALYNLLTLVVYALLVVLRSTILRPRPYGKVKDKYTNSFLPFAILRIFYTNSPNEVIHKITDKTGKYYCLLPNGEYQVKIESKNIDESYTTIYTSESINVDKGYINKKFEV